MKDTQSSRDSLTPRASELVAKTDATIERAVKIFSDGNLPEESWVRLTTVAREEERGRKLSEAIRNSLGVLRAIDSELDNALKQLQGILQKTLHPLLSSNSTYDEERGRYAEEYAYRVMTLQGVAKIKEEYQNAWKTESVEACTALIEWGDRIVKTADEARLVAQVKTLHVNNLELNPVLLSIEALTKKRELVSSRLAMLGAGVAPDVSLARNAEEARAILQAGGLAVTQ